MFVDTVTISKQAIKKYGTTGAIVLQVLYNQHGTEIPVDHDEMKDLFKDILDISQVKSSITKMYNDELIFLLDDVIYLNGVPEEQLSIFDFSKEEKPVEKEEKEKPKVNETWQMADTLCDVLGYSGAFKNPKRYLREAKKIIKANYTIEFIKERYGKGGDWYTHEFKGQKGSPPNMADIYKTIDKDYTVSAETTMSETKSMWS